MAYRHCGDRARRNAEIHRLDAEGLTIRQIAARLGWSKSTVHEVLTPVATRHRNMKRRDYMRERSCATSSRAS